MTSLALVLVIASLTSPEPTVSADPAVVAVAPFRVSGADSSLAYLREGMVDLLAAKLGGTARIRAADPRTLLAAWRKTAGPAGDLSERDAIKVAERVGAGRMIHGGVVGSRQQVTLNAVMLDVPSADAAVRASVEGSADSLPRLVDQLAAKLLALEAGEGEQRLPSVTSTSLPALRAYLEGQALVRRGQYQEGYHKFSTALQHDSTFALAGLGLTRAGLWIGYGYEAPGSFLAWRHRDKLAPSDRALLYMFLGERWPAPNSVQDGILAAERLVQMTPDNAEAWLQLGDNLYHHGALGGIADAHPRAALAFGRARALDSSFAPAYEHGAPLALALGDTAGARKALAAQQLVSAHEAALAIDQWAMALALGDSALYREVLRYDSLSGTAMQAIGLSLGLPLQDAEAVLRAQRARAVTAEQQQQRQLYSHINSIIIGWPSRAIPLPASLPERERHTILFTEARFADGDSAAGAQAGDALEAEIGKPLNPGRQDVAARYAGGQAALDRGRLVLAQRAVADLREIPVPSDSTWLRELPTGYALLLEAQLASRRRAPELPKLLAQLDSALVHSSIISFPAIGNLISSELWEKEGDLPRALAAIRRRAWDWWITPLYVSYHRQEGRLAALNGDREGAIRAYRRYLALRSGAEPRLQPQVERVRAELDALQRETTDR